MLVRMLAATEIDQRRNRELIKLIMLLYFLVKHHKPDTTMFEDLITLQIDIGSEQLEEHRCTYIWDAMLQVLYLFTVDAISYS